MIGWRDEATHRFPRPAITAQPVPRARCRAMVATGEVDVAILTFGGVWDFAATEPDRHRIRRRVPRCVGWRRFDTTTAVFTNGALVDPRSSPGWRRSLRRDTAPAGENGEHADWNRGRAGDRRVAGFGIRSMPSMSARQLVDEPPLFVGHRRRAGRRAERPPFVGVTTDGRAGPACGRSTSPFVSTEPITDAALAFLEALTPEQRRRGPSRWTPRSGGRGSTST